MDDPYTRVFLKASFPGRDEGGMGNNLAGGIDRAYIGQYLAGYLKFGGVHDPITAQCAGKSNIALRYNGVMYFRELSETFAKIEATSKRLEKTAYLAEILKKLEYSEVAPVMYMTMGRVAPLYENIEFGLAEKQLLRTIAWASGKPVEVVTKAYKKVGDLGELAREVRSLDTQSDKTIEDVFSVLRGVARDKGAGSQERKIEKLGRLLKTLDPQSAKYVMRLTAGKARLGFSDLTVLDALSTAQVGDKGERAQLERAYNVSSDLGYVAVAYLQHGAHGLANMDVAPGVPVRPMRAERLGTVPEIVEKLVRFAVEPKFDGMRVQIHAFGGSVHQQASTSARQQTSFFQQDSEGVEVKIFSRGLEDITAMFPDVVEAAQALHKTAGDFVLDGEALGIDLKTGRYLPFQETMTRKRKYDVGERAAQVPLRVQVFDVLYADKRGTLGKTYEERRRIIERMLNKPGMFSLAESTVVTDTKAAQKLFDRYMVEGLEGMLCKRLDSHYQAGARNYNWVKYKRAHEDELVDTVDGVVMGYYLGRGKRQQFGIGAFLVGVLDEERIVTVAKIGTGLTDEQFREMHERLQANKSSDGNMPSEYNVPKQLVPDVWVTPKIVVEIQADEITKSPIHTAFYALRFPRLIQIRDDKGLEDITTAAEVKQLYELQVVS